MYNIYICIYIKYKKEHLSYIYIHDNLMGVIHLISLYNIMHTMSCFYQEMGKYIF